MLCHARRHWDNWGHARNSSSIGRSSSQQRVAVPTSLEFSSPKPPPKTLSQNGDGEGRAGFSPWNNAGDFHSLSTAPHERVCVLLSGEKLHFHLPSLLLQRQIPHFPLRGARPLPSPSRAIRKNYGGGTGRSRERKALGVPDPIDGLIFLGRSKAAENCGRRG